MNNGVSGPEVAEEAQQPAMARHKPRSFFPLIAEIVALAEAKRSQPQPNNFQILRWSSEIRFAAIKRLKAKGHKQPNIHQIMAEIGRMKRAGMMVAE
jgi:hypothetical protein